MKNIATRFIVFAAAALSFGSAAYGQNILKAYVPFAFGPGAGSSGAGRYIVRLENTGTGKVVHVQSQATGKSALAVVYGLSNPKGPITPHLIFRCGQAGCALAEIWTREAGYGIPAAHVRDSEYLAYVALDAAGN